MLTHSRNILENSQMTVKIDTDHPRIKYLHAKNKLRVVPLTDEEIIRIMKRTDGNTLCETCGKPHREHPYVANDVALDGEGFPFLHVLCDNRIVKL